jgi:lipoic acid synthetase
MVTLIDTLNARAPVDRAVRHPEKQNRPDTPVLRKPEWLRVRAPGSGQLQRDQEHRARAQAVTVCEEAACPNIGECWTRSTRPS